MSKQRIEDIVLQLSVPVTDSLGLELVDVEYVKEGANWFLRIYIDKQEGITHDDCQAVSASLGELLDKKDPIHQSYVLEVSSPGIERPLKRPADFVRFRGHMVRATTFAPVDGQKEFIGVLEGLVDGNVLISVENRQVALPQELVAKVRLEAGF
ncbi:ribosome maturation factor RimP [Phosphitispora sp. TUW77]|uniref:ribosome maturation factor RimP n=1 Tax=Phosphitispora sp. TUW77 TaxID=3152361 RepID=UPI003AB219A8